MSKNTPKQLILLVMLLCFVGLAKADVLLQDTLTKARQLQAKGIELLVWEDRLAQTNVLARNLLQLPDRQLSALASVEGLRIVPAKVRGHLYHSSTNILYLQQDFDIQRAYEALGVRSAPRGSVGVSVSNARAEPRRAALNSEVIEQRQQRANLDRNRDHIRRIFRFRVIDNVDTLFNSLVSITPEELPILYDGTVQMIYPINTPDDPRVFINNGTLYIHTGLPKDAIIRHLKWLFFLSNPSL